MCDKHMRRAVNDKCGFLTKLEIKCCCAAEDSDTIDHYHLGKSIGLLREKADLIEKKNKNDHRICGQA
jgi:hypothetical protein